jgi:hypothetical protein
MKHRLLPLQLTQPYHLHLNSLKLICVVFSRLTARLQYRSFCSKNLRKTMAEASKKVKDLDDWLPITKSRNAKWWYSAFHNVTAMVGAGVLGLPYAMSQLGWYAIFVDLLG